MSTVSMKHRQSDIIVIQWQNKITPYSTEGTVFRCEYAGEKQHKKKDEVLPCVPDGTREESNKQNDTIIR